MTSALAFDRAWDDAFRGRPAVSLCVYIVDDVEEAARSRRVASLARSTTASWPPAAESCGSSRHGSRRGLTLEVASIMA